MKESRFVDLTRAFVHMNVKGISQGQARKNVFCVVILTCKFRIWGIVNEFWNNSITLIIKLINWTSVRKLLTENVRETTAVYSMKCTVYARTYVIFLRLTYEHKLNHKFVFS